MRAQRLSKGGTIGIVCMSHPAEPESYSRAAAALERLGFRVKLGAHIYEDAYGYAAAAEERAADFNAMAADEAVGLVLFGGGEGAVEVLPLIDYEMLRRHPKLLSSYSDGTSILNAVHARTGLVTYYGMGTDAFFDLGDYDYRQFCAQFVEGCGGPRFLSGGAWRTLRGGRCAGTLLGGFASLVALGLGSPYFRYDADEKYLLFLEDHERFNSVGDVGTYLGFLEQSGLMPQVTGLIFGHYAVNPPEELMRCLARFGERNGIPVVYTDDFGHGARHGIFPIGARAELDADARSLLFL